MPWPKDAKDPMERLLARVEKVTESGCWIYMGSLNKLGYGRMSIGSRTDGTQRKAASVHRIAYELLRGPIPPGLDIDHLCRVRCCVNPDHLEPVSERVNIIRGQSPSAINAAKTECPRCGGPYRGRNRGGRVCPKCDYAYRKVANRLPHRIENTRRRSREQKARASLRRKAAAQEGAK